MSLEAGIRIGLSEIYLFLIFLNLIYYYYYYYYFFWGVGVQLIVMGQSVIGFPMSCSSVECEEEVWC